MVKRSDRLEIRLTLQERKLLEVQAKKRGLSVSALVRMAVLGMIVQP